MISLQTPAKYANVKLGFRKFQVEEGDGLPASICLSCNRLLDASYDFQRQIQDSDVKLRQILKLHVQSILYDKDVKDTTIVKDIITDVISNVASCRKDNGIIEQEIYSPHDTVTFDSATIPSEMAVNDESCHEFMQKAEKIIYGAHYGTLKENIHNAELALCHEKKYMMHEKEIHTEAFVDHSNQLASPAIEDKCNKQEQMLLSEDNETSGSLADESREENTLKMEIKNEMSLENLDRLVLKQATTLETNNPDMKNLTNCSDDEEKPLICRTARQRCLHCIKSFATKLALQRHMIMHKHKTKLRYVCYICDKQFSNIAKLKSHMRNNHKTDGKVSQEDSQNKRVSKASGKITRNCGNAVVDGTREEKRNFKFTCKVCSKQFIYQKSFISHAKNHPEYNEETSDALDQSPNKTNEQRDNKIPIFRENESEEEEEEEEEDEDDSELPIESLQCTQCGKLFATKRNLKRHISTHSGLKFNCSTCGKGFSRVDKLKDHEQSKHKEEIFGNTDDEDDDEEDNENKVNENSESRKKVSLFRTILHTIEFLCNMYNTSLTYKSYYKIE